MTPPMTETRDAVARAICASDFDGDETVFDQMIEGQQQNFRHNADAALACLKPGSRFTVDGVECVVISVEFWKGVMDHMRPYEPPQPMWPPVPKGAMPPEP